MCHKNDRRHALSPFVPRTRDDDEEFAESLNCAMTSDKLILKMLCSFSPSRSKVVQRADVVVRRVDIAAVGHGEAMINHYERAVIVVIGIFIG